MESFIFHMFESLFKVLIILGPLFHIFVLGGIFLSWVALHTVSPPLAGIGYKLPVFEEVVVIEHLLDLVHFLLITDSGCLEG